MSGVMSGSSPATICVAFPMACPSRLLRGRRRSHDVVMSEQLRLVFSLVSSGRLKVLRFPGASLQGA
jgi:hypothetical protein